MKTEVLQQRIAWDVSVTKMKQMQNWQTVRTTVLPTTGIMTTET